MIKNCGLISAITAALALFVGAGAHSIADSVPDDMEQRLSKQYREAKSEIEKRDLTLKMIDATGILKKFKTTTFDVARIFGTDWTPGIDVGKYESYGIIRFAQQPKGREDVQNPYVGWYLVIHYNTKDKVVISWNLSDDHK